MYFHKLKDRRLTRNEGQGGAQNRKQYVDYLCFTIIEILENWGQRELNKMEKEGYEIKED